MYIILLLKDSYNLEKLPQKPGLYTIAEAMIIFSKYLNELLKLNAEN